MPASITLARTPTRLRELLASHRLASAIGAALVVAVGLAVAAVVWQHGREEEQTFRLRGGVPSAGTDLTTALYQSVGAELRPGHDVTIVGNGAVFDALESDIRQAKASIHVDIFIWQMGKASDRLLGAITERARAGVACRILVDDAGSPSFDEDVRPPLEAAGCEVRVFRRSPGTEDELARNHRKIVVIDGRVAFTGGFGIRDEWLGDGVHAEGWRDANVRFTGPAVAGAQQAIAENWQEAGGALFPPDAFPVPDATGPITAAFVTSTASPVVSRAERLVQFMAQGAKKRLWIANAYFVPPESFLDIIKGKARSGVDVRILVPGKKTDSKISMGSQHMEYGALVTSGVRVLEYEPSMMHAKTMVVDEELAMVSTINLEPLSLGKLEEDALVVVDRAFTADLARTFEADCAHARTIER